MEQGIDRLGRELICPICLGLCKTACSLPCNHNFCTACIKESIKSSAACPICKLPATRREVRPAPFLDKMVAAYSMVERNLGMQIYCSQFGSEKGTQKPLAEGTPGKWPLVTKHSLSDLQVDVVTPSQASGDRAVLESSPINIIRLAEGDTPEPKSSGKENQPATAAGQVSGGIVRRGLVRHAGIPQRPTGLPLPSPDVKLVESPRSVPPKKRNFSEHRHGVTMDKETSAPSGSVTSECLLENTVRQTVLKGGVLGVSDTGLKSRKTVVTSEGSERGAQLMGPPRTRSRKAGGNDAAAKGHGGLAMEDEGQLSGPLLSRTEKPIQAPKDSFAPLTCTVNRSEALKAFFSVRDHDDEHGTLVAPTQPTQMGFVPQPAFSDLKTPAASDQEEEVDGAWDLDDVFPRMDRESTPEFTSLPAGEQLTDKTPALPAAKGKARATPDTRGKGTRQDPQVRKRSRAGGIAVSFGGYMEGDAHGSIGESRDEDVLAPLHCVDATVIRLPVCTTNTDIKEDAVADPAAAVEGPGEVRCAFCGKSGRSDFAGEMLWWQQLPDDCHAQGQPLGNEEEHEGVHAHEDCVIWAPDVHLAGDVVRNLRAEVGRGRRMRCVSCRKPGAALGCFVQKCRKTFHYACAKELPCEWDQGKFVMLCPDHAGSGFPRGRATASAATGKKRRRLSMLSGPKAKRPAQAPLETLRAPIVCPRKWQSSASAKWVLCGSSLDRDGKGTLVALAEVAGATVTKDWSPEVTHLIAGVGAANCAKRTLKYMMAILHGQWVVSPNWVAACLAAGKPVVEATFEIPGDVHAIMGGPKQGRILASAKGPKLFHGLEVYFSGSFPSADQTVLMDVLTHGGGTVLHRKPASSMPSEQALEQLNCQLKTVNPVSSALKLVVLYNKNGSGREEARSIAAIAGAVALPHTWLLDSASACSLVSVNHY